jgi:hypothetical protein
MKKCPPGVICIENVSFSFIIICLLIIVYFVYSFTKNNNNNNNNNNNVYSQERVIVREKRYPESWPNFNQDPLLNPYTPPLRDDSYYINIPTNPGSIDTNYRQLGLLTPVHGNSKDNILPLMGRQLFTNRDKWQYYSTSNQHNNVKLPLMKNGRSCTNEYGCDQIFSGDIIYVEGVNEKYKVTMYDNATMRYIPLI